MVVFIQRQIFYIEYACAHFFNNFVTRISRCYLDKVDNATRVYLANIELMKKKELLNSILYAAYILDDVILNMATWKNVMKIQVRFYAI